PIRLVHRESALQFGRKSGNDAGDGGQDEQHDHEEALAGEQHQQEDGHPVDVWLLSFPGHRLCRRSAMRSRPATPNLAAGWPAKAVGGPLARSLGPCPLSALPRAARLWAGFSGRYLLRYLWPEN